MALAKHNRTSAETQVTRRGALAAAAVSLVAPLPVLAGQGADTPVMQAYREWKAYRDWLHNETSDLSEDRFDELCDERRAMELAMFDLPNTGLRDVALKLMAFTDCGNDFADDGRNTGARLLKEMGAMAETGSMLGGAA